MRNLFVHLFSSFPNQVLSPPTPHPHPKVWCLPSSAETPEKTRLIKRMFIVHESFKIFWYELGDVEGWSASQVDSTWFITELDSKRAVPELAVARLDRVPACVFWHIFTISIFGQFFAILTTKKVGQNVYVKFFQVGSVTKGHLWNGSNRKSWKWHVSLILAARAAPRSVLHMKSPSTMGHKSLIQRRPSLNHPGWLKYFFKHTIRCFKLPYT